MKIQADLTLEIVTDDHADQQLAEAKVRRLLSEIKSLASDCGCSVTSSNIGSRANVNQEPTLRETLYR